MSDTASESSEASSSSSASPAIAEVKGEEHAAQVPEELAEEEQSSATSEDDLTAGMGLQILVGSIADFDPEGDDARPFE